MYTVYTHVLRYTNSCMFVYTLYIYVYLCTPMYTMYTHVHSCTQYTHILRYTYTHACSCSHCTLTYTCVHSCTHMYAHVYPCTLVHCTLMYTVYSVYIRKPRLLATQTTLANSLREVLGLVDIASHDASPVRTIPTQDRHTIYGYNNPHLHSVAQGAGWFYVFKYVTQRCSCTIFILLTYKWKSDLILMLRWNLFFIQLRNQASTFYGK